MEMRMGSPAAAEQPWNAHARLWNMMLGYINSMSLKCAVELGIADAIHGHGSPVPLPLLLSKLSIPPPRTDAFRRLMRHLVRAGIFARTTSTAVREEDEEAYCLTSISETFLLRGREADASSFLLFMLDPVMVTPYQNLSSWLTMKTAADAAVTPFESTHGKGLFEFAGKDAKFNRFFNEAMASDTRLLALTIIRECGDAVFGGLRSLVDVGGGNGTIAMAVAEAFPQLKCTVFDLPHVVASLEGCTKVDTIEGDMFKFIPPADAVLLKWILHDWCDEDCIRILQNCKEAIPSKDRGGKVIIVEMVMRFDKGEKEMEEAELLFDVFMMGPLPGKERSEAEWNSIFTAAGFSKYKIIPILGLRSVIEVYY